MTGAPHEQGTAHAASKAAASARAPGHGGAVAPALELRNIDKWFGSVHANGFKTDIRAGLIGAVGCYTRTNDIPTLDQALICMCLLQAKRSGADARGKLSRSLHAFWEGEEITSSSDTSESSIG